MQTTIPESLETERLALRCPRAEDGIVVNEALRESWERLQEWMHWAQGEPPPVSDSEARQKRAAEQYHAREEFHFSAFLKATGEFVGKLSLLRLDWEVPKGEIGYWIRTKFEGQGLVTEAVMAMTDFALEGLRFARVEIRCDSHNRRSAAVAERAGYTLEGRLRNEARDPQGRLRDTLVYARIAPG